MILQPLATANLSFDDWSHIISLRLNQVEKSTRELKNTGHRQPQKTAREMDTNKITGLIMLYCISKCRLPTKKNEVDLIFLINIKNKINSGGVE